MTTYYHSTFMPFNCSQCQGFRAGVEKKMRSGRDTGTRKRQCKDVLVHMVVMQAAQNRPCQLSITQNSIGEIPI